MARLRSGKSTKNGAVTANSGNRNKNADSDGDLVNHHDHQMGEDDPPFQAAGDQTSSLHEGDDMDVEHETEASSASSTTPQENRQSGHGDASHSSGGIDWSRVIRRCLIKGCPLLFHTIMVLIMFMVFVAPAVLKLNPDLPKHIVYLNAFKIPLGVNLSEPEAQGFQNARNFYLRTAPNITIGAWHILPDSVQKKNLKTDDFEKLLSSGSPIMLYCHGNTGSRGTGHRIQLYKVLTNLNFHVIAMDYRGYGDSSGSPTSENGLVHDVIHTYMWVRQKAGKDIPIYVWGHSLGTGIATKAVRFITNEEDDFPKGLILESPFNNGHDAAMSHPFALPFKMLWWFDDLFLKGMHDLGIYLKSDEHIKHIDVPTLILHAEDDFVVPYALGKKLYEAGQLRPSSFARVEFKGFSAELGYRHKGICTDPDLPQIIRDFTGH